MRFSTLRWPIAFVFALLVFCGAARTVAAGQISAEASAFVGEFRAFVADFSRWDAAHLDLPLVALALTPEQQRSEMVFLLWYLWMHDHSSTATNAFTFPSLVSLAEVSQPIVTNTPGGTNGSGTVSSFPGSQDTGGGTTSSTHTVPEPSSLVLAACGSLGLIAYRLVRARARRGR